MSSLMTWAQISGKLYWSWGNGDSLLVSPLYWLAATDCVVVNCALTWRLETVEGVTRRVTGRLHWLRHVDIL